MLQRRDFLITTAAGCAAATLSTATVAEERTSGTAAQGSAGSGSATTISGSRSGRSSGDGAREGIALALGGGAAKALAHIPLLEALDDLGVKPAQIAGTSMGAILGGLYASGMTGTEIRSFAIDLFAKKRPLLKKLFLDSGRPLSSLFNLTRPAIIEPMVLFEAVLPKTVAKTFSELEIPLKIVATDFHNQDQVVLEDGLLMPAIAASSALPVLLTPVRVNNRVLIDGGFVNPTPFDILDSDAHHTVAVDVTINDIEDDGKLPSALETWMGSFTITLHSIVREKLKRKSPDALIRPPVGRYKSMDFFKIDAILDAGDAAREEFKHKVGALLDA